MQLPIDVVFLGLAPLARFTFSIRIRMGVEKVLELSGNQLLLEHGLVLGMCDLHDALPVKIRLTVAQVLLDARRDQQDVPVAGEREKEAVQHAHQRVRDLRPLQLQRFSKGWQKTLNINTFNIAILLSTYRV